EVAELVRAHPADPARGAAQPGHADRHVRLGAAEPQVEVTGEAQRAGPAGREQGHRLAEGHQVTGRVVFGHEQKPYFRYVPVRQPQARDGPSETAISCPSPGARNSSSRVPSSATASRSAIGCHRCRVSVVTPRARLTVQSPTGRPSTRMSRGCTFAVTNPCNASSAALVITRERSACDRNRLSKSYMSRTGAGVSGSGRSSSGRSYRVRPS